LDELVFIDVNGEYYQLLGSLSALTSSANSYVRCPKCGSTVPAKAFCIYCGEKLGSVQPTSPVEREAPSLSVASPPQSKVSSRKASKLDPNVSELMKTISSLYTWKVKLLDLFSSDEVSSGIFLKLYGEYSRKLNDLLNKRVRKIEEVRSELKEREAELGELRSSLKELEIRHMVGELNAEDFRGFSERVKLRMERVEATVRDLSKNLSALERILIDKSPREVYEMEKKIRKAYEKLEREISEEKIGREMVQNVRSDMESMLETFDSINKPRKEKLREIQDKLVILNTRFKVGEIAIDVYEKEKRELEDQLEKVWT